MESIKNGTFYFYPSKEGRTPRIMDIDFLDKINWVNFRTQASLDLPCALCGNSETEMHHIRHIRKSNVTEISPIDSVTRMQSLRNRKQIPVCRDCHMNKIHSGLYKEPPLKKLYDNRIVNSENSITIRIVPFQNRELEERLKDKGWIQKNQLEEKKTCPRVIDKLIPVRKKKC